MSHFRKKILVAAILGAAAATPTAVLATNGYFAHGYGTKNKGLVGAGVALPQDSMAAATNPAGMVMVGDRMDVGLAIFSPSPRSYEASQPPGPIPGVNADGTKVESENDFFLIPHFARNWMLDDKSSVGVTVYGNGGMNTKWKAADTPGGAGTFGNPSMPFNAGDAGVDLMQLFIATTYAQKIDDKSAWGASLILAHQRFEATGLTGFGNYSADPANISDNGVSSSTGFGVKLGIQSEVSPGVTVAASYQSQMSMGEFDEYAGLFADGGSFDIPATATIGLAWETSPKSTLVLDIQKIMYSGVDSIANPGSNLGGCPNFATDWGTPGGDPESCLGGSNGAGFGWEDMTIVKLGYQWDMNDMTWRVGYSTGDQPIPDTEVNFNVLAPGIIEKHLTFGFTKAMDNTSEINFAFMHALENSVEGNPTTAQTVKLEMLQYEFELSYGKRF